MMKSAHGKMSAELFFLKEKLTEMLSYFDKSRRCIYVDYPLHTNVGDLLINAGCEQFFFEHGVNIWRHYNFYDFPRRIPGLRDDDVFLLHGGGNFGDIWFHFQSFRERILAQYPDNRVIFLPQTVHFSSQEKLIASIQRINTHRNCHVFVRDSRSLHMLQDGGLNSVSLMPDTAHALTGVLKCSETALPKGTLRLLRQDQEASDVPSQLSNVQGETVDWDLGVFGYSRRVAHLSIVNFVKGMGRYGPPIDWHTFWYWHRNRLIKDTLELFCRYETILTNRLHAVIASLMMGRSVIAFDNSYGKLSAYFNTWLPGVVVTAIHRAERLPDVGSGTRPRRVSHRTA